MRRRALSACALLAVCGSMCGSLVAGPEQAATPVAEGATDYRAICQRLVGEWEGQVQVRRDGALSASVVSASNRLDQGQSELTSYVEGFAFGQPIEVAVVIRLSDTPRCAWAHTLAGGTKRGALTPVASQKDGAMVFEGQLGPHGGSATLQQRVVMPSPDQYLLEVFSVSASGEKELLCKLDMRRLPQGQVAAASEMFRFAEPVQQARELLTATAQVSGQ